MVGTESAAVFSSCPGGILPHCGPVMYGVPYMTYGATGLPADANSNEPNANGGECR
jgi:hypothetical protein